MNIKNYSIVSPKLEGILSDDFLFFEEVKRPTKNYFIKDGAVLGLEDFNILDKYLNDIYNLFLRKVSFFISNTNIDDEEIIKLQALLQEIIKVKRLINLNSETESKNLL